jgi:hypothetical protein
LHSLVPVFGDPAALLQRSELWHSRLAVRAGGVVSEGDPSLNTVRAVWVRQGVEEPPFNVDPFQAPAPGSRPFRMSLDAFDRHNIVHLSSNFGIDYVDGDGHEHRYFPEPIPVNRLGLSALGAWVDLQGTWSPPGQPRRDGLGLSVEEWTHRGSMGRDHYVRVVYAGFLFPFGHAASLVKVTERRFHPDQPGNPAFLRQRMYLVVREPVKHYPSAVAPALRRQFPFVWAQLLTLASPSLDPPRNPVPQIAAPSGFWPEVNRQPFLFHVLLEDLGGHRVDFLLPLLFLQVAVGDTQLDFAIRDYEGEPIPGPRRTVDIPGAPITLTSEQTPGQTTFETSELSFGAAALDPPPATGPHFYPQLRQTALTVPALKLIAGVEQPTRVTYAQPFIDNDLGGADNVGEVFGQIVTGQEVPLNFSGRSDRSGGLVAPSLSVSGLSRSLGPVGGADLNTLASGTFNPTDFFRTFNPTLLGVLHLSDVLPSASLTIPGAAPAVSTERLPDRLYATYSWSPKLQSWGPDAAYPIFIADAASFNLTVTIDAHGSQVETDVDCTLSNFQLNLIGKTNFIILDFESVHFHTPNGKKPDVSVKLRQPQFVGVLSFVEALKDLIPLDGFSDPPALRVDENGIAASFSLGLPPVAIGVFSLQNLSLGAGFSVPFVDAPLSVRFNFCERQQPFLLTVTLFGGGGFFAITLNPHEVQELEAALEFGAAVSVNLGVASGGVHVLAGIYYHYTSADGASLTGYFRMGGYVSVLGLISVSIELYLGLSYQFESGKCVGTATITVEIDILFFSTAVQISCEKKFAGSSGDPTFAQMMAPYRDPWVRSRTIDPWQEYCQAYV